MPSTLKMVFAAISALTLIACADEEGGSGVAVPDPDKFCEEVMSAISSHAVDKAEDLITTSLGRPTSLRFIPSDYLDANFTRKIIDKDHNSSKHQIAYYSYTEHVRFVYFQFDFKKTGGGWVMTTYTYKGGPAMVPSKDLIEQQ